LSRFRGSARQIVDRITFEAHIVETGTQSYRLRSSQRKHAKSPTAPGLPSVSRVEVGR
jgi:hypothetical protein